MLAKIFYNPLSQVHRERITTFDAALPYGVTTCTVAVAGAALTLAAVATAVKVAGIILGIIGTYTFISVILCAVKNSDNPRQFQMEINKAMITAAGSAIVSITDQIVRSALDALIDKLIYGERAHRIRLY